MRGLSLLLLILLAAPAQADDFTRCLRELRAPAAKAGVRGESFTRFTAGLRPDPTVLEALDFQPEFKTPIWDYLAGLVDDERIADGRARLGEQAEVLRRIEQRYGVDAAVLVALWGVESDYGRIKGGRSLLQSLATLSCAGRRQAYFRGELFAALSILQSGDIAPDALRGSWAGAFGQTQFMPSTFLRIAVDFDGDGRRDLVGSSSDALASAARYLQDAGWRRGQPWGFEAKLPAGFDTALAGRRLKHPLGEWARRGVTRVDGSPLITDPLGNDTPAAVLLPAGREGPAFVVLRNFDALFRYNAAESYALAIAHLSDRLRGAGAFATPWPTDDPGLSRAERRELQALLLARGHDIGTADGLIGSRTRAALQLEQAALGLPADGRAGRRSLEALRRLAPQSGSPPP